MNDTIIGKCSLCGGRVTVPSVFHSVIPPKPTCESCGAIAAEPDLPVVPMQPVPKPEPKYTVDKYGIVATIEFPREMELDEALDFVNGTCEERGIYIEYSNCDFIDSY